MTIVDGKPGSEAILAQAQENLSQAHRLDAIHPLGGGALSAFARDVVEAGQVLAMQNTAAPLAEILKSEDIEVLKGELKLRAEQSRKIFSYVRIGHDDIDGFDRINRHRVIRGATGKNCQDIYGDVLVVHTSTPYLPDPIRIRGVYLIGGHIYGDEEITFPNPSVHTLRLDTVPATRLVGDKIIHAEPIEDEFEWVGPATDDVSNLGQSANSYFSEATFAGPFDRAIGHNRAYKFKEFGELTYEIPESGNPSDIQPGVPQTKLDVLVKNAIEGFRVQERIRELQEHTEPTLEWSAVV